MRSLRKFLVAASVLLMTMGAMAQSWQTSKIIPVGGAGAWDYVAIDSATHRIFLTRTTHTQVLDEDGKVLMIACILVFPQKAGDHPGNGEERL